MGKKAAQVKDGKHQQIVSKERVSQYGEVYTSPREVNAMLDLVKQETDRFESRFLEPACGTGNFLAEILKRKLNRAEKKYSKSQLEYERYAVAAVASIYGIDIQEDNVKECRQRLFGIFDSHYSERFKKNAKNTCRNAVRYILQRNIIHGNALTLKTAGNNPQPIIFSEWTFPFNNSKMKRRDFAFHELIPGEQSEEPTLFSNSDDREISDHGEEVFIPEPVKEFPLTHYLKVADAES